MNQQYRPTPTRREYTAVCPVCNREFHFRTNDTRGARCIEHFVPLVLKMPPTVAAEGRQEEISQPEYNTKEVSGQ